MKTQIATETVKALLSMPRIEATMIDEFAADDGSDSGTHGFGKKYDEDYEREAWIPGTRPSPLPKIGESYLRDIRELFQAAFEGHKMECSFQRDNDGTIWKVNDGGASPVNPADVNKTELLVALLNFAAHLNEN